MSTASTTRTVLLPDDSMLLELLARAEQLLEVITLCEQDTADDPEEPAPWHLPAPLADGVATSTLSRVSGAVHAHLAPAGAPRRGPRLLAPDRRYEHLPLRRVPVSALDAETLVVAARVCHQALTSPSHDQTQYCLLLADLHGLLGSIDHHPAFDTRVGAVAALAGLAALLAEPVGDLGQLAHLLAEAGETDLVLTAEAEQAYHRVADWMNNTLTGGDPLERWAW